MKILNLLCGFAIFMASICPSLASGKLSDNIRIESDVLGYALQYRVYTPEGMTEGDKLPTIYVTDGQWYISMGEMVILMDRLIDEGKMRSVIAVFIDNRNPDDLSENRRNQQLLCDENYVKFYVDELIDTIEAGYPVSENRKDRVIQGVSFGGLNAACFGLMAHGTFGGISMHSPANNHFLRMLQKEYKAINKLDLKMFLSFGNEVDNLAEGTRFKQVLIDLEYEVTFRQVPFGHNWKNWKPLLDDALLTFFATD